MNIYAAQGVQEFIVACGYKAEMIKEYFINYYALTNDITVDLATGETKIRQGNHPSWKVHLVDTGLKTASAGRVKRIDSWLGDDDVFMMTYGDGVADVDIRKLLEFHRSHGRIATMTTVHPPARFGAIQTTSGALITEFSEKPQTGEGRINGGFFVLNRKVMDYIDGDDVVWERQPLEGLARAGELCAYEHDGFWQCMDTVRDRHLLEDLWASPRPPWRLW
jgi:glucose-1-phosphate cytidylyltransferase